MNKKTPAGYPMLKFERPADLSQWKPPNPPQLQEGEKVSIDFEYKGSKEALHAYPIGVSCYSPDRRQGWYLPFGHEGGGNLPEEVVKRWFTRELANRDVYNLNMKAEVHVATNWNVDCEAMGLRPHDVAYAAALLNENRRSGFSLEALCEEYLPENERKVHPNTVDPAHFWMAHAGEVADRAVSDARQAWKIHEVTQPQIEKEELTEVLELEDNNILPVCEMEHNGAILDRPKLEKWSYQLDEDINNLFMEVHKETGLSVNPNKSDDMQRLFNKLGLEKPKVFNEFEGRWEESFGAGPIGTKEGLRGVDNPVVQKAFRMKRLMSIKSKYIDKYLRAINAENKIFYHLHQLRADKDGDPEAGGTGTVTGRFSCGGGEYAINTQQVMKGEKQIEELGPDYIVRELYIAALGMMLGASDASQIEFRLFGHYSKSRMIREAYHRNPMEDFHMLVTKMMKPHILDEKILKKERKHMKHNNFGVIYGMGRPKLARRLGFPCCCPWDWRELDPDTQRPVRYFSDNTFHLQNCPARIANDIMDEYDEKFPEAKRLLKMASKIAKDRGFVKTLLGRRRRYPDAWALHSALNAVIQGSAADIFKLKLLELYRNRKALGITLRMPVHDEFVYDVLDLESALRVHEFLNRQSLELSVPILWETGLGFNWQEANSTNVLKLKEAA